MKKNIIDVIQIIRELRFILDRRQKKRMVAVFFVMLLASAFELMGVTAILPFIQAIISPEQLIKNRIVARIVKVLGLTSEFELIFLMAGVLIIVYLIKNIILMFSYYVQYTFSTGIQKEMSIRMLRAYVSRPYEFFLDTNTAEVMRGVNNDIPGVYQVISQLLSIMAEVLTIILIGIYIISTEPFIAVATIGLLLVVMLIIVVIYNPIMKKMGKKDVESITREGKAILQLVGAIKEIYVMQKTKYFMNEYCDAAETLRKTQRNYQVMNSSPDRIIEGVCVSGLIGIICIRLSMNVDMVDFIPKLGSFAMAAFKILPSVGKIANRMNAMVYFRPTLANVYANIEETEKYEKEIQEYRAERMPVFNTIGNSENVQFKKELVIDHISWKYRGQTTNVLEDASLKIFKNQSVALIGASGAGKTTLADIVLGLLLPQQGGVFMDGIDVFTMPVQWAQIVGYVPQTVYLVDDTVKNNVTFGTEREVSDEEVWEALEQAQLKAFIKSLPDGLSTMVGERGMKLSGGQRQRIAIARALFKKPDILVLDEATAALDNETESAVMEAIESLQGKITLIIVAHRLTTIRNCDVIYEVKDGKIIERSKEEVFQ